MGATLKILLQLANGLTLIPELQPDFLLGLGSTRQIGRDALPLELRGLPFGICGVAVPLSLLAAGLHLTPFVGGAQPAGRGVGETFGGESQVSIQAAKFQPNVSQPASDLGPLHFG